MLNMEPNHQNIWAVSKHSFLITSHFILLWFHSHTRRQFLHSSLTLSHATMMIFLMFTGCSECTLHFIYCCLSSSLCSSLTDGLLHALGDQWHPNPHSHSSLALGSTAAAQTTNNPSYRLTSHPFPHMKYPHS